MWTNYHYKLEHAKKVLEHSLEVKGVVVFDIDDTLIDEHQNPIPPTVDFYNWIKNKGFIPVIVTARAGLHWNIQITKNTLKKYNITDYPYIFFRPFNVTDVPSFKTKCRKHINETIGKVVASVGDKIWDTGDYGGYPIVLT